MYQKKIPKDHIQVLPIQEVINLNQDEIQTYKMTIQIYLSKHEQKDKDF
jgi:hypothetical protein